MKIYAASKTKIKTISQSSFFPLFVDVKGKTIVVFGGGKIAERRIAILVSFGAEVTIVSPDVTDAIHERIKSGQIKYKNRKYEKNDIDSIFLAIAATNDRTTNHSIMKEATDKGIFVIVADCREECNCYFPAIIENSEYIAGLVSKNGNHTGVKKLAKRMRGLLSNEKSD